VRILEEMRKLPLIFAALMVAAVLVPAQAQAFKPKIIYVRATNDNEGIRFTVKVRMDKGGRDERKVAVTYNGNRKSAQGIDDPPVSMFETGPYASAPVKKCYRVKVRAHNQYGTTTKTMRADRIGTNGCD
jgi:hypothetical protein